MVKIQTRERKQRSKKQKQPTVLSTLRAEIVTGQVGVGFWDPVSALPQGMVARGEAGVGS